MSRIRRKGTRDVPIPNASVKDHRPGLIAVLEVAAAARAPKNATGKPRLAICTRGE
jgi:hypothetical protein